MKKHLPPLGWILFFFLLIVNICDFGNQVEKYFSSTNDAIVDYTNYCDSVAVISGELKLDSVRSEYDAGDIFGEGFFAELSKDVQRLSGCQSKLFMKDFHLLLFTDGDKQWLSVLYMPDEWESVSVVVITDEDMILDMSGLTRNDMKNVLESLFEQLMLLMEEEPSLMEIPTETEPETLI